MNNPKLSLFLPYFYLVWSDNELNNSEFDTLSHFIHQQNWLAASEKEQLVSQINPNTPPSRAEVASWKTIVASKIHEKPKLHSLFDAVLILSDHLEDVQNARTAFETLENDLGLLGEEALAVFKSEGTSVTGTYTTAASFDIAQMTAELDGDQAKTINEVKTIISRPEFEYETNTDITIYREKVLEWCKILAAENLGNRAYPKKYGGGEDIAAYFTIMETLSYHDLSLVIKFGVQFGLWGMSVFSLGTEKHYEKYLSKIGTLELPGCFAMTETNHGSNVKGIETTATYNHETQTFVIHTPHEKAQKEYIGNAANHGKAATVFAKLIIDNHDYGVTAFIVPLRDENNTILPGITIADCGIKMGLNGVDNGTIRFDHVVIPKENMLDKFAQINEEGAFETKIPSDNRRFFTMLGTLVGGRIGIPRSALAAAKSGLTIAIRYGDTRKQFGPENGAEVPILNYRMHQRRLMPLLAKSYALHFSLRYLTQRFLDRKEEEMQEIEALAAGMKAYTTWFTRDTLQECREACGGKGYLSENRIAALKNDTEVYTTFEGDNTVLMQLVAKNRLSEFRKEFGKMGTLDTINFVLEQAKTAVTEKNPLAIRNTNEVHLLDPAFHLEAFQYREKRLVNSAAQRLKKLIDNGIDPYDAANIVQHQMVELARAYLDRVVLEEFLRHVSETKDLACQQQLKQLAQLFALAEIEKNKGWYLEEGYMEGVKTKAIRKLVNQLCWETRQNAVPLVHAFAIPKSCLHAPIITTKPALIEL